MLYLLMKKFLFVMVVLVAAAAALVWWYAPARALAEQVMGRVRVPLAQAVVQQEVSAHSAVEPAAEPVPAPAAVPAPEEKTAPEGETAPEEVPEPAPAPEPELPVLNAEAEALLPRAETGDAVAQFNLARQYALGEGMVINRAEFVRWCRMAAEQGLPEAQYTMGCCYLRGLGVGQNAEEGRRMLEAAAAAGYAPAAEELKR